jgi:FAD/FMN-containing dehydrogenase
MSETEAKSMGAWRRGAAVASILVASCASRDTRIAHAPPIAVSDAPAGTWCHPDQPCWPAPAEWTQLARSLQGKLVQPKSPLEPCRADVASPACAAAARVLKNPYAIQDDPGGTQSLGYFGAWTAEPSAYAVAAETARDVVTAVNFARQHHLRLVVKGAGHDYLGRSSAADSLLVWTHPMRRLAVEESFVADGCPPETSAPAITIEAGARWLEVYQEAARHRRYVQGGGCMSVGAAGGFLQGGGFGPLSKQYGAAASNLLQARVVTADGALRVANACQNAGLFWALRGGGGGTFGVVTEVALKTDPLANEIGFVSGSIRSKDDQAFVDLLRQFVTFYGRSLENEHWGEKAVIKSNNALLLSMPFVGLTSDQAKQIWAPFRTWLEQQSERLQTKLEVVMAPGGAIYDPDLLEQHGVSIHRDDRTEHSSLFWGADNQGEVATYWRAYTSRWIPAAMFEESNAGELASVLFRASREWSVEVFFDKGLAGASAGALARGRQTSMNPAVFQAAALAIVASDGEGAPGVQGHEPDLHAAQTDRAGVMAAMKILRDATPGGGAYVNEADYFEPDWQRSFWGDNYGRLLDVKHKYDPDGLFTCHHCVGSSDVVHQ